MTSLLAGDGHRLVGARVEVLRDGRPVRSGIVDAASRDGAAVWLRQEAVLDRMLVHRDEGYQVQPFPTP